MKPGFRLTLLGGCVLVAALVCPHTARVAVEDWLGPYSSHSEAHDADFAHVPLIQLDAEDYARDVDGDADSESAHDAP